MSQTKPGSNSPCRPNESFSPALTTGPPPVRSRAVREQADRAAASYARKAARRWGPRRPTPINSSRRMPSLVEPLDEPRDDPVVGARQGPRHEVAEDRVAADEHPPLAPRHGADDALRRL